MSLTHASDCNIHKLLLALNAFVLGREILGVFVLEGTLQSDSPGRAGQAPCAPPLADSETPSGPVQRRLLDDLAPNPARRGAGVLCASHVLRGDAGIYLSMRACTAIDRALLHHEPFQDQILVHYVLYGPDFIEDPSLGLGAGSPAWSFLDPT